MTSVKRILVVDDEEPNRSLLEAMLQSLGYEAELASDGTEALGKLKPGIDLVLLDVMMPGMDGFEVARRIRGHPDFSDIPIIMVTILSSKDDRLRAIEAGANDFVAKPVDRLELRVRVASLLKMKEAQDRIKSRAIRLKSAVASRTTQLQESEAHCRRLFDESRRREELYRSFLTSCADAVIIYDMQGRAQYVSPSFTRIFGWSGEELQGKRVPYVPDSERDATSAIIEKILLGDQLISDFETRRLCKDGRVLDISLSASRYHDHDGNAAGMVVILHDITRRKETEKALRTSEELFRTVFEAAQDSMFLKDDNLRYAHVNPAMLNILELPEVALIGKTDDEVFGTEAASNVRMQEVRVLQGQTIESEQTMVCKPLPMTFTFMRFPIRNSDGDIVGICGIARDVTDRKRVHAEVSYVTAHYPSEAMAKTLEQIRLAARTDSTVLLLGENGSGKDYLARYLHDNSRRATGPFFNINCAALAPDLAESEFFGHEPGAFTGARGRKRGLLELAEGGTLLLNEIGDLSPGLQAKLLTFLDSRSFTRLGGEKVVSVNVRLVAATNREIEAAVQSGNFRQDLFYRLNVFSVRVPPLRERIEDLPYLVQELLRDLTTKMGLPGIPLIDPKAIETLGHYKWPGNVRELRNVLERALILCRSERISIDHLVQTQKSANPDDSPEGLLIRRFPSSGVSMSHMLHETKNFLITEALGEAGGSVTEAAKLLHISRESLKHHMRTLGLRRWKTPANG